MMIRLNLIYDLLQTTKISSGTVGVKREKHTDQIYFVICNSCYWCAAYFGIDVSLSSPLVCHGCGLHNTELMPISTDESFRIKYSPKRGVELEFYR
jgi:hypothetical protein